MRELRYAVRQLLRSPGFTAVALITLTLGIGANTAFFSVLYGVVLRQAPYPDAARLVSLHNEWAGEVANGGQLGRGEFRDLRDRQRTMEGVAASDLGRMTLTSSGDGFAERVKVSRVSPNLFSILRVPPAIGRGLHDGDERAGAVAVISHETWQSRFGGDSNILDRTIRLNGVEYTIVGVMPAGFGYPEAGMAAWLPIDMSPRDASDYTDRFLAVIGRLAAGTSKANARLDLRRVARDLQRDTPGSYSGDVRWSMGFRSLREGQFGRMLLPLGVLMAAASSVLLIACVNVAIMSLLRAISRRREISIRLAVGASRRDVARQLLAEAAILCVIGTASGLLLARFGLDVLKAFGPGDIPRLNEAAINIPTALFTTSVMVIATLVIGLAPVLVATRLNAFESGFSFGRSSENRATTRLRDLLTVTEIALAASLLVCAGLTLRTLHALTRVDLGFATAQRFSFKTNLTEGDYPDAARVERFYADLTARLEALPGTASIGAISYLPLSGEGTSLAAAPADSSAGSTADLTAGWGIVRGRYFETMGIALLHGRLFSAADRADSQPVAIVDEVLARRLWKSESAALGQRVRFGSDARAQTRTVIGVVRHVTHEGPGSESLPMGYAPQSQVYQRGMYTVIRTTGPAQALMTAARRALANVDPSVPMYFAHTVTARYDQAVALPRFTAGLVGAFSVLALVLAGVGIFGVTGYAVAQRTREFGIRFALGAQRGHVGSLVLRRVGLLAGIGIAAGVALGRGLGSLMSGILFGVRPNDPLTLIAVMGAIALTAVLASLAPLRRAVLVDPVETLRAE
jgi:predicted permease